nr:MAG TPA: hypothetical protein [Caudoviricetes sp.]
MNSLLLTIHQVFTCSPFDCFSLFRGKGWVNSCEHLNLKSSPLNLMI